MKRRGLARSIVLLLILSLSFVPIQAEAQQPRTGGTMTVAFPLDPGTFNGILQFLGAYTAVHINIFNRLLRMDNDYNLIPDLAERWQTDGKTYTFSLRRNATWHDGRPFTSADVKFHFELLTGKTPSWDGTSPSKSRFQNLESIETPDANTVIFKFSKVTLPWIFAAPAQADVLILPKHLYEGRPLRTNPANLRPVGTGPFKFVEYSPGSHVILEANREYFAGRPFLDRLIIRLIPRPETALIALEAGEIDAISHVLGIPLSEVPRMQRTAGFFVVARPYDTFWKLSFSQKDEAVAKNPWLRNAQVRKAIGLAINKRIIIDRILFGVTTPLNGPVGTMIKWAYNPNLQKSVYDPQAANRLLDRAGLRRGADGTRLRVTLAMSQIAPGAAQVGAALRDMLGRVGVDVRIDLPEQATFQSRVLGPTGLGDIPMWISTLPSGPDPDILRDDYHSTKTPPAGFNSIWLKNNAVDELLDEAGQTLDQRKRADAYKKFQELMVQNAWEIYLWHNFVVYAYKDQFDGFNTLGAQSWFIPFERVWRK